MSTSSLRRIATVLAVAAAPASAALLPVIADAKTATKATVTLKNTKFTPAKVTIARGGSVKWLWKDGSVAHNVTFRGAKKSPTKSSGTNTVKFSKKGTFRYSCTIHSGMNGSVVVK